MVVVLAKGEVDQRGKMGEDANGISVEITAVDVGY